MPKECRKTMELNENGTTNKTRNVIETKKSTKNKKIWKTKETLKTMDTRKTSKSMKPNAPITNLPNYSFARLFYHSIAQLRNDSTPQLPIYLISQLQNSPNVFSSCWASRFCCFP